MMYVVKKRFKDKETKNIYEANMLYISNNKSRIDELKKLGFLGIELIEKIEPSKEDISEAEKVSTIKKD